MNTWTKSVFVCLDLEIPCNLYYTGLDKMKGLPLQVTDSPICRTDPDVSSNRHLDPDGEKRQGLQKVLTTLSTCSTIHFVATQTFNP